MNRLAGAAFVALLLVSLGALWGRSCAAPSPATTVDLDRPAVVDAGREPTRRDTADVSGTGGSDPVVRIEYRDRWRTADGRPLPAPSCPDGSPAVPDTVVRVVTVPAEASPVVALPNRPVSVSPSRVVLTYQDAEGETAGRTVQEVFRVPRERLRLWADVGAGAALPWRDDQLAGSWRRPYLSARAGLDVRPSGLGVPLLDQVPGTIGLEADARAYPSQLLDGYDGALVAPTVWARWRPLDWRR